MYTVNHFKDSWGGPNWLSKDELDLFSQYGFYSKPFTFNPKGKVIAINTNAANNFNNFMLSDKSRHDPGDQLKWLEGELLQLEEGDGFAYIIGHIPAYNLMHEFGIRYKALVERF